MSLKNKLDPFVANLFAASVIGLFLRLFFMNQAMRYDESFTFLIYVNKGPELLFYYSTPNNHIFHTILAKISVTIFGPHPWALRLPALISGVIMIPLAGTLGKIFYNKRAGVILAYCVSCFPYLILYSTNARGYTLLTCFSMLCAINLLQYFKSHKSINLVFLVLNGALGLWTVPTMAFFLTGIYLWAFYLVFLGEQKRENFFKILLAGLSTIIVAACLYYPVAYYSIGYDMIYSNKFVVSQPWNEFFQQMPQHILSVISAFLRDIPVIFLVIAFVAVIYSLYCCIKPKEKKDVSVLIFLTLGAVLLLVVKHRIPYARTWIFMIPFFLLIISGLVEPLCTNKKVLAVSIVFFTVQLAILCVNRPIEEYEDTGLFPEIIDVANTIIPDISKEDKVHINLPGNFPFYYYRWFNSQRKDLKPRSLVEGDYIFRYYVLRNEVDPIPLELDIKNAKKLYSGKKVNIYRAPWKRFSK